MPMLSLFRLGKGISAAPQSYDAWSAVTAHFLLKRRCTIMENKRLRVNADWHEELQRKHSQQPLYASAEMQNQRPGVRRRCRQQFRERFDGIHYSLLQAFSAKHSIRYLGISQDIHFSSSAKLLTTTPAAVASHAFQLDDVNQQPT